MEELLQLRATLQLQVRTSCSFTRPSLCTQFVTTWITTLFLLLQVDASDPTEAVDVFLKIASLYSEDPETKAAVLETIGNI